MKKYVKPQVKFEFFALSESIATSCDMDSGWLVRGSNDVAKNCYAQTSWDEYGGMKVFNESPCNQQPDDHCYTLFSATANLTYSSY